MEILRVEGGHPLHGTVRVEGAKNSILEIMAATVIAPGVFHLDNVPNISDVRTMTKVLEALGASVEAGDHTLTVDTTKLDSWTTPYEYVRQMRASIEVLGPLIARFGKACVSMPGGCNLGTRAIDQHMAGLEVLGVEFINEHGDINAHAEHGITGATVTLDFPSVGATENIMMASVMGNGVTVIENAAREPEIVDTATFLNKMGADVRNAGSYELEVHGVKEMHGCDHYIIGDRIEAGTFVVAGALCGDDDVTVTGFDPMHLDVPLAKLAAMGVPVERHEDSVTVRRAEHLMPADIQTLPFPGFATDMQPEFMVLDTMADGSSFITENIFENRFMLVAELVRMGADIRVEDRHALVKGLCQLTGAPVNSPDLRGGASLALAGLVAEGITSVYGTNHIKRGYENFPEKLNSLGACTAYVEVDDPGEEE